MSTSLSAPSSSSAWLHWLADSLNSPSSESSRRAALLAFSAAAALAGAAAGLFAYRGLFSRRPRVLGVIPARWASSRFKGKPLALILGKPMVQRTWEKAKLARTLTTLVVATDDDRIASCCRGFGADVIMTSAECNNGSERCAEALGKVGGGGGYDIVVNIQGDEPLMDPDAIDAVVYTLQRRPDAVSATAVADLPALAAANPNRVKCVVDQEGCALYFSRALIPGNQEGVPSTSFPYLLHLGLQSYRAAFLREYVKWQCTPLEAEEQLEQLRILETGHRLAVVKVKHRGHGVDVPADVPRVEEILRQGKMA